MGDSEEIGVTSIPEEAEVEADETVALEEEEVSAEAEVPAEAEVQDEPPSKLEMSAQVYNRIAECLSVELASLDRQIARADEVSARDGFFTRWKTILELKRSQCVTALEKARQAAAELTTSQVS